MLCRIPFYLLYPGKVHPGSLLNTQQAHDGKTTSNRHSYDVIKSNRRQFDVRLTSRAAGYCLTFSYRDPVFHIVSLSLLFYSSKIHPKPLFNIVFLTFSRSCLPSSVHCRFLFAILFWLSPSRTSRKHCQPITASRLLCYVGTSLLLYPGKVHPGLFCNIFSFLFFCIIFVSFHCALWDPLCYFIKSNLVLS